MTFFAEWLLHISHLIRVGPQQIAWFAINNGAGGLSDTTYHIDAFEEFGRHNHSFWVLTASYSTLRKLRL